MEELVERYSDGEISRLDGISSTMTTGTSTSGPPTRSPLLRLNLESVVSRGHLEKQRDEVLSLIRA
jgi:hypothetical protein